jgi:hypothetical protein
MAVYATNVPKESEIISKNLSHYIIRKRRASDMFMFGHCGEVESILAWMPLPEPYREDYKE